MRTDRPNPLLIAPSRQLYLTAPFFDAHRAAYATVAARVLKPRKHVTDRVQALVHGPFAAARAGGGRVVGLHCRADHDAVRRAFGGFASCATAASKAAVAKAVGAKDVVYIATDSIVDFTWCNAQYKERCLSIVATRGEGELHRKVGGHPGGLSLDDAADVLVDTWALASSDLLVHNSESSVGAASACTRSMHAFLRAVCWHMHPLSRYAHPLPTHYPPTCVRRHPLMAPPPPR